jgi:carbonic anhydrase
MGKNYDYDENFSGRLASICSDERFVKPTLKFLDDELNIGSCDFIVIPGGPEFIANGEAGLMDRMDLLIKAHGIKEIVLISHEDCGYYNKCYSDCEKGLIEGKLLDDLKAGVKKLNESYPEIKISGFHCVINGPGNAGYIKIASSAP